MGVTSARSTENMKGFKKYFVLKIKEAYPGLEESIMAGIEENYKLISKDTAFSLKSPNPLDRRLDFSAYFLSLIKTLDSRGESFEQIKGICLDITIAIVTPKSKFRHALKKIFPRITNTWFGQKVIRYLQKKVLLNKNPEGFVAEIITDKKQTFGLGYGVDILECGICKLFKKHGSFKYAAILCEVDEITSRFAGLELIRNGTIANGAKKCDFRYRRLNSDVKLSGAN